MKSVDEWRAQSIRSNIVTFAQNRNGLDKKILSLKFRPVGDIEGSSASYLYPKEYAGLVATLGLLPDSGAYFGGGTYSFPSGDLLIEHETGPEILLLVKQVADAVEPFVTLAGAISLIVSAARFLVGEVRKNCSSRSPDRHCHDARFLRVERREIGPDGVLREETVWTVDLEVGLDEIGLANRLTERLTAAAQPSKL